MTITKCSSLTNKNSCILQQQVNNGRVSGCYNTDCPGFVVQSSSIPLNAYFANISTARGSLSTVRGSKYEYRFSIKQVKFTNSS
jgi:hypothetical protein